MTAAILDKLNFRWNWVCILSRARMFGIIAISAATGGWLVSIRDQSASLPYKDRATTQLEQIHKEVGANPVAQIKCDRKVAAAVATVLAKKDAAAATPVAALPVQVCPPPVPFPSVPVRK